MRPQPNEGAIAEILDAGKEWAGILDDEIITGIDDIADNELRFGEVRRAGHVGDDAPWQRRIGR
jgi:hypothetical protein